LAHQEVSRKTRGRGFAAEGRVLAALTQAWKRLPKGGSLWLAVSGGLDSMVLLEGLARLGLSPAELASVSVLHVNHGLRGEESDGDEAFVRDRVAALGLSIRTERLDWREERPSQAAARSRRERLYAQLAPGSRDRIWLAHHLNDQAETVFFRLLRGTGLDGLAGMRPEAGKKVRPFLGLEKSDLLAAAGSWGIAWREDSSNRSLCYSRNWLRSFFPEIEKRHPGFQKRLAALAAEARDRAACEQNARKAPLSVFSWGENVDFFRAPTATTSQEWKRRFGISRIHAEALVALLKKNSGKLEAEGVRFFWSQKVLMAEKGGSRFSPELKPGNPGEYQSPLGVWRFSTEAETGLDSTRGESLKKRFQKLGVPLFFRPAIPVTSRAGRPLPLWPPARDSGADYRPSALAQWWLAPGD
jgi:tRNA(Ile)-lysidine synthetase-like protein